MAFPMVLGRRRPSQIDSGLSGRFFLLKGMSCVAVTGKGVKCGNKGKFVYGVHHSCGIKAHVAQVQKLAGPGVTVTEAAPTRKKATVTVTGGKGSYRTTKRLGSGAYGAVWEVETVTGGSVTEPPVTHYALKRQKLSDASNGLAISALVEADILSRLTHPNLVQLHEVFLDTEHFNYVLTREERTLREFPVQPPAIVKDLAFQLLSVVQFLHQQHLIHADLKPENILISVLPDTKGHRLKLTDFGLLQYDSGQVKTLQVQTFWYRAPEIYERKVNYNSAIDIWSVGLILRELVTGYPLSSSAIEKTYWHTVRALLGEQPDVTADFQNSKYREDWDPVEWNEYIRLVNGCLRYDPSTRLTVTELLASPLFAQRKAVAGTIRETPIAPTRPSSLAYQWLRNWTAPHSNYHQSSITLASRLFDRACAASDIPVNEERDFAVGALNLALKVNQRLPLAVGSYRMLFGRDVTVTEMQALETRLLQLLEFRLQDPKPSAT